MGSGMGIGTYSLCFFLGPGFPLTLGSPLPFAAAVALLLTPFFLGPSVGGPIAADWAAGVPAGGELGVESDAFSVPEVAAAAGDCLAAGVSSLTKSGSTMARSFWGGTLRVTMWVGLGDAALVMVAAAVLLDLRRSLAAAAAFLLEGAIAASKIASMRWAAMRCWWLRGKRRRRGGGCTVAEREILLCHGDDAWAQAWMDGSGEWAIHWLGVQGAHTLSLG